MTTQHLVLLGLLLAGSTPTIIAAIKQYAINNPAVSAVVPFVLSALAWIGDALLTGLNPFSEDGMTLLIVSLTGSLAGAKGRDVVKHTFKKAA